jgi:hypothetical protein
LCSVSLEASIAEDWVNPAVLRRLKRLIQTSKAIDLIDEHGLVDQPSSRRKDQALRTRLFAEDIVRLHYERFRTPKKNAVFQLVSLPVIEQPLEMRTIERIIQHVRARRSEMAGKTVLF